MSYLSAPNYGPPNRVTCIPGYATSSTCKILVATIYDPVANPVTLTVNGVVVNGTLVARGSAPVICWTGAYTATGLPAFTRVSWSVIQTVGGVAYTDNGSLMTAPTTRTEKFTLFHASCDNNTRFSNDSGLIPRNVIDKHDSQNWIFRIRP